MKNSTYQRLDSCLGVVIAKTQKGVYIELDNGERAFAYDFLLLQEGQSVLCTIKKLAGDRFFSLVSIDSTLSYC
ncbi:MAG: hypothetical protein R3Y09_11760 [Clostridia bacterium]